MIKAAQAALAAIYMACIMVLMLQYFDVLIP